MSEIEQIFAIGVVTIPLIAIWLLALFHIVVRRSDLSIWWKGIWSATVLLIPYIGVLVYVFVRPPVQAKGLRDGDPTATRRAIEELHRLVADHDSGSIAEDHFATRKAAIFGIGSSAADGGVLSTEC